MRLHKYITIIFGTDVYGVNASVHTNWAWHKIKSVERRGYSFGFISVWYWNLKWRP